MSLKNRFSEMMFKVKTGADMQIIDEEIGDEVTIKYKDFYINVLIGKDSKEPQSLGWSHDPTMFNTPIREILVAKQTRQTIGGEQGETHER